MSLIKAYRASGVLGSYPHLTVVFSTTMALFIIGLFGMAMIYANRITDYAKQSIEIKVFLQRNCSDSCRQVLQQQIVRMPYTREENGNTVVKFISKEEAGQKFIKETGENFDKFLGENPLRDAIVFSVEDEYLTLSRMATIKKELETQSGVFEVYYVENLVDVVTNNVAKVSTFLGIFSAVLLLAVILLINNTVKLALFSQRFLIRSMQLVGAKQWFIQKPFVLRAGLQGLIGGAIATALIWATLNYLETQIEDISKLHSEAELLAILAAVIVTGGIIGTLSSLFSVRRYLRLSLDELY